MRLGEGGVIEPYQLARPRKVVVAGKEDDLICRVRRKPRQEFRSAPRRRLALARPKKETERTLKLIGLESKLPVFPSVAEASAHVASQRNGL